MANSPKNSGSFGKMAERHRRRGAGTTTGGGYSPRRPESQQRDAAEREYQETYERQLLERRQQRAAERRESRQREILSGRVEKRRSTGKVSSITIRRMKLAFFAVIILVAVVTAVMAYDRLTGSQFFVVRKIDLQGVGPAPQQELNKQLAPYRGRSLWQLDLREIRTSLEKNNWIQDAEVTRVLPDSLKITVRERKPVAPARTAASAVIWVDQEGRSLGELDSIKMDHVPPIASGLDDGAGDAEVIANKRRMALYQRLLAEVDGGGTKYSDEIDEVDVRDAQAARVHLSKYNLYVMLGDRDFGTRLERSLKLIGLIEKRDIASIGFLNKSDAERLLRGERIAYLNVTHPERVIIGFAR